jgi:hypothetical protein
MSVSINSGHIYRLLGIRPVIHADAAGQVACLDFASRSARRTMTVRKI